MKTTRLLRKLIGLIALTTIFVAPQAAFAQSAAVVTKQVLPPGSNACAPLFVSEVTSYIYDGELHSFDVVVSDPSYVGLLGTAGDTSIPFNYITRRIDPNGSLRIHVDTTVVVNGSLPVSLVLLSADGGSRTCLTTVSFVTDGDGSITTDTPTTPGTGTGTSTGGTGSTGGSNAGSGNTGGSTGGTTGGTQQPGSTTSTSTGQPPVAETAASGIAGMIARSCADSGASQLWFILIAIFFVIVAFVGLSQPPLVHKHSALPAALIGVPLVLLLAFWLWIESCRLSVLIPIILIVAAAIGLYAAYRSTPMLSPVIELPAAKTKKTETKTGDKK